MSQIIGGDKTRSGYVRYVPVMQADVPAPRSVLEVRARTRELCIDGSRAVAVSTLV